MYIGIRELSFLNFNTVKVPYLNPFPTVSVKLTDSVVFTHIF